MRKTVFVTILALLTLMLLLVACDRKVDYRFMQDPAEIQMIEIVRTGGTDPETGELQFETICTVQDIEAFLADFRELECKTPLIGDPTSAPDNTRMFRVVYSDGAYELIHCDGQSDYHADGTFWKYMGRYFFDEVEFQNLIQKYLTQE